MPATSTRFLHTSSLTSAMAYARLLPRASTNSQQKILFSSLCFISERRKLLSFLAGIRKTGGCFGGGRGVFDLDHLFTCTAQIDELRVLVRMVLNPPCPRDPFGTVGTAEIKSRFFYARIHSRDFCATWETDRKRNEARRRSPVPHIG